ncbi:unnamed protein product [Closterium sp. Yama58-4]|nr:unnamed protein product [Closterium sp. Yama58-4]
MFRASFEFCYFSLVKPTYAPSVFTVLGPNSFSAVKHTGKINEKHQSLGEVLNGDQMVQAPYDLKFRIDHERATLCKRTLGIKDVLKFRDAVLNDYYFQMYLDDLPIWGFIGMADTLSDTYDTNQQISIFTHIHFNVWYNNDRVVEMGNSEDTEVEVEFTYSVSWRETDKAFEKRMDKYTRYALLPQHVEIHWFSILNSCFTVLLLAGFIATRLTSLLKSDLISYSNDTESLQEPEEAVWKSIHDDVFRIPTNKELFCAFLGSGMQLLILVLIMFMLTLAGVLYPFNHGASWTALVVIYALTSGIAGYTSASFYKQMEGTNWTGSILLTGCMFGGPVVISFCFLNTVAILYHSTNAKPLTTILTLTLIFALIALPLLVAGAIAGKKSTAAGFQAPCRHSQTSNHPREIPAYMVYGILFIVFINFIVVTALMAIVLTYYQLAAGDHEWWWSRLQIFLTPDLHPRADASVCLTELACVTFITLHLFPPPSSPCPLPRSHPLRSVLCGGSPALFIFGYCCYNYHARSHMTGFMQASFYFVLMACVCYGLFLMLGAVGFLASLALVRRLYRSIGRE